MKRETVNIPKNVSVNRKGYVYLNGKAIRNNGYPDHLKKELIGRTVTGDNIGWKENLLMYPNDNYYRIFDQEKLPEILERADHVSVGGCVVFRKLAEESGLIKTLQKVFDEDDVRLILDLAMFMDMAEDAAFSNYPDWAIEHAIFSDVIKSDRYISEFEKRITISQIEHFKYLWAQHALGSGKVFLCYDSTNVNSQAEGVTIVEKGHAKDDPSKPQLNTDYIVRQSDGLPLSFTAFPGSIADVSEASEMLEFFQELFDDPKTWELDITVVADRAYMSRDLLLEMDKIGLGFLLMLKKDQDIIKEVLNAYADQVKSLKNYILKREQYSKMFEHEWLGKTRYFHITLDGDLDKKNTKKLIKDIEEQEKKLRKLIATQTRIDKEERAKYEKFFKLTPAQPLAPDDSNNGKTKKKKKDESIVIANFERKNDAIDLELYKCGFYVLVSSNKMEAPEALEAYSKRDRIEKVFMILKSFLGGDKIGVQSTDAVETKSLIWFVASILRALLFNKTEALREKERSAFPATRILGHLHKIWGYRNLRNNKFKRQRRLTERQKSILKVLKVSEEDIDEEIARL